MRPAGLGRLIFFTPYSVPPVGGKGIWGPRYGLYVQLGVQLPPMVLLDVERRLKGCSSQRTWNVHPEVVLEVLGEDLHGPVRAAMSRPSSVQHSSRASSKRWREEPSEVLLEVDAVDGPPPG